MKGPESDKPAFQNGNSRGEINIAKPRDEMKGRTMSHFGKAVENRYFTGKQG
jgi:hypothetical protein